jgi:hypothetical protein
MKTVVAWEDLLTLPSTRWQVLQGRVGINRGVPASNLLTNDLTQVAQYAPSLTAAQPIIRFRLEVPSPVAVVAVMNWLTQEDILLSYFTATATVRLRDGDLGLIQSASVSVPAQRLLFGKRSRQSAFALFSGSPVAKYVDVEFDTPNGVGGQVGRIWASRGMVFDDAAEESWTTIVTDDGVALVGATGGVRPAAGARGRQVTLNLSGLSFAQAYGSMQFGTAYAPALVDLQCFAGASRPVLVMVRADGAIDDVRNFSVLGPLNAPVTITRGEQSDAPYAASLSLLEAAR